MTNNASTTNTFGAAFTESISAEAMTSAAVDHPYLRALRDGDFPDVQFAFRDFAFHYGQYSTNFTGYVSAVIKQLSQAKHRRILEGNLAEEQGDTHDVELPADVLASVEGIPHPQLYRRFQDALGVDFESGDANPDSPGAQWSRQFQDLCESNECTGAGAIGIGTEFIVARIFDQILGAIKTHTDLTATQRVFFDLHSVCDEKHAAEMLSITEDLAQDQKACDDIEHGVREAIRLRAEFWDQLLQRALAAPAADSHSLAERGAVGHQESL